MPTLELNTESEMMDLGRKKVKQEELTFFVENIVGDSVVQEPLHDLIEETHQRKDQKHPHDHIRVTQEVSCAPALALWWRK